MSDSSNPPPGRALTRSSSTEASGRPSAGFQRTAGAFRVVLPHLLRLLPLLDGNIGSAVSNLLSPPAPVPPPPPPVNLEPIENGLTELQAEHRDLRAQLSDQVLQQNASIERVEARLGTVEETAASNAIAQQELLKELKAVGYRVEELKASGRKTRVFALIALSLLAVSIALNFFLLLYFRRTLP